MENTEKLTALTVESFADVMASDAPAPGGGSASALSVSLGAALLSMVCAMTKGKEKYKEYEALAEETEAAAQQIKAAMVAAVDSDTDAFNAVSAAFGMPKATDEEKAARSRAIQEGLVGCIKSPLAMMEQSLAVLRLAAGMIGKYNINCASDLGVGVQLVKAGLTGAWLNVKINLGSLKDKEKAAAYEQKAKAVLEEAMTLADKLAEEIEASI